MLMHHLNLSLQDLTSEMAKNNQKENNLSFLGPHLNVPQFKLKKK